ncbi:hypothetical protein BV25DRAFT_1830733 [Artomyces pyxidatus]|uniref:Uncharacterized protein n=1 Tax=Artomyces pyxidatus TaxID=48021 RepID=A0ACB8SN25_9AGAM|nr:hypothetical protein BV25DRAFT_1830733 [Artomyces pyxidatus]
MAALRQRIPFTLESNEESETVILDEQEQEEVIENLRTQEDASNRQFRIIVRGIVGSSLCIHLWYLVRRINPFNAFFTPVPPIPAAALFALIHIAVHANLLLLSWPTRSFMQDITPLSYPTLYAISGVAPLISFLAGRGAANVLWWSFALGALAFHHAVQLSISRGQAEIAQLETLRYNARGA